MMAAEAETQWWDPLLLDSPMQREWVIDAANNLLCFDDAFPKPPHHPSSWLDNSKDTSPKSGSEWPGGPLLRSDSGATFDPKQSDVWWNVPLCSAKPPGISIPAPRDPPAVELLHDKSGRSRAIIKPFLDHELTVTVQLPTTEATSLSIACWEDWTNLLLEGGAHNGLAAMTYAILWTKEATAKIFGSAQDLHELDSPQKASWDTLVLSHSINPTQEAFVHLNHSSIDFFLKNLDQPLSVSDMQGTSLDSEAWRGETDTASS